jgi:hypothetical protein
VHIQKEESKEKDNDSIKNYFEEETDDDGKLFD